MAASGPGLVSAEIGSQPVPAGGWAWGVGGVGGVVGSVGVAGHWVGAMAWAMWGVGWRGVG